MYVPTQLGLNLVDLLESVFHLCMYGCTYSVGIVCMISWQDIANLLLVSLLFIVIATPFLNFYLFLVCLLYIVQ